MVRPAIIVVAIVVLLGLAGCGGGSDDPPGTTGRDINDLDQRSVDTASKAQIESFAKVRIPSSATNLRSSSRSAMDTQMLVSFRLPRRDLAKFVRSGGFRGTLTEGDRAIASTVGSELGWQLDQAKRVEGLSDVRAGLGRNVVVVLDDPERPVVHLEAATL